MKFLIFVECVNMNWEANNMTDKLIFFVDDEPMFINLVEYTFKGKNGYRLKTFKSCEECIKSMDMNPDLVIVDFFLQGVDSQMTGLDVLRKIQKTNPTTPVVFLSGNDDISAINEAKAVGAKKYILKNGYFINNLIECVSEILNDNTLLPI